MVVFHGKILDFLAICRRENDDTPWDGMLLEFQGLMLTCQRRPCCQFPGFWKIKTPNALACIMIPHYNVNMALINPPTIKYANSRFKIINPPVIKYANCFFPFFPFFPFSIRFQLGNSFVNT
jgi:hypothetical protein